MPDKFRVHLRPPKTASSQWPEPWPGYFYNFYQHCVGLAAPNGWEVETVKNHQLRPHGRLIQTKTQGWYLRWDDEKYHMMFVLKWS